MTVIAYRDGIMAADSVGTVGDMAVGDHRKVVRSALGFIAGASGDSGDSQRFLGWILDHGPKNGESFVPNDPDMGCMWVSPDGTVTRLGMKGTPYIITAPFHAMGAGREIALGAMAAGATAEQAVEIAIKYIFGCGGPVQVVKLHREEAVDVKIENSDAVRSGITFSAPEPALVPPDTSKFAWHWLAVGISPPFPAKWHGDHWIINGSYCSRSDAAKRCYRYIGECL